MLAQETWDVPPPTLIQAPIFQPQLKAGQSWRLLPIVYLDNFERITGQFASFGLQFENVIAFCPSNPRFMTGVSHKVLMPSGHNKGFKVDIEADVSFVHLWLIGSQEITVSTLNVKGHCIATAETPKIAHTGSNDPYPEQSLTIETRMAKTLCIDSKAPFTVTRFAVRQ